MRTMAVDVLVIEYGYVYAERSRAAVINYPC